MSDPLAIAVTVAACALLCGAVIFVCGRRSAAPPARPCRLARLYRVIPEGPPRGVRYLPTIPEE